MRPRITCFACAAALFLLQFGNVAYAQSTEDLLNGLPPDDEPAAAAESATASTASTAPAETEKASAKADKKAKDADKKAKDKAAKSKDDKKSAAQKDGADGKGKKQQAELESREDVIKSVQRRPVLKKHRLELSAMGAMTINDPLYLTFAFQGSANFFLAESLSIGVGVAYFFGTATLGGVADVRRSERAVPSVFERPNMAGTLEFTFNPLYGKASFHNAAIGHVDTYLIGGFGGMFNFHKTGRPCGEIGIGQRFNILSWLNIKWELRDYIFNDTVESDYGTNSDIQNYFMLNIGVGFFVPPTFTYKAR